MSIVSPTGVWRITAFPPQVSITYMSSVSVAEVMEMNKNDNKQINRTLIGSPFVEEFKYFRLAAVPGLQV
jgi:hypothetical protein